MSQREQVLENRLRRTEKSLNEYRTLYETVVREWDKLHTHIEKQQRLLDSYQKWFEYHKNWTRRHNKAIRWNIEDGRPDNYRVLKVDKEIEEEREKERLDREKEELLSTEETEQKEV